MEAQDTHEMRPESYKENNDIYNRIEKITDAIMKKGQISWAPLDGNRR